VFDLVPFVKMVAKREDENKRVEVAIKGIMCGKLKKEADMNGRFLNLTTNQLSILKWQQ
jgi:hypothetical protein